VLPTIIPAKLARSLEPFDDPAWLFELKHFTGPLWRFEIRVADPLSWE